VTVAYPDLYPVEDAVISAAPEFPARLKVPVAMS